MTFDDLNSDNCLLFAIKAYDKPNMLLSEFKEDYKRFHYLKKLFKRYRKYGDLKEQLILNHIMVLYNVFGVDVATRMLFFKMSKEDYPTLKTYLLYLSCMPERIHSINGKDVISSDIPVDLHVADVLRKNK